ncbi:FAD-dependent monooxygenase [Kitasatospora sp. NPDC056138]|uniref:FAD-dependent monooxygenase n=1 Tax=Kitasatospora sp. NPDC056138 TaxID=3345724 RepID=UPI0035D8BA2E
MSGRAICLHPGKNTYPPGQRPGRRRDGGRAAPRCAGSSPEGGGPTGGGTRVGSGQADGVTATVETPVGHSIVRARYAVGTDGGRSTVRSLAGIDLHGTSHPDQR